MKKFLILALKLAAILIVILALVPLLMPKHSHVERSIEIAAKSDAAYALLVDQGRQKEWSPWVQMDPNTQTKATGTGVGSVYEFSSEKTGAGTSTIVEAEEPKLIKYHLVMIKPMPGEFDARMDISPTLKGCRVTWSYDQDFSYFTRYFGPLMEKMVGDPYQQGVENIRKLLEAKP